MPLTHAVEPSNTELTQAEAQPGWVSWAWSYVPELVYYEDEEEQPASSVVGKKRPDPILAIGLYCRKGKIEFKVSLKIWKLYVWNFVIYC